MAITRAWNETTPVGSSEAANDLDGDIHNAKTDIREQLTDGNHLDISLQSQVGARHVARSTSSGFPIYDSTGLLEVMRVNTDLIEFGDGVANDYIIYRRYELDSIVSATTTTFATITLQDDSSYIFEVTIVAHANSQAEWGTTKDFVLANRNGGGTVSEQQGSIVAASLSTMSALSLVADPSTNDLLLRVSMTYGGGGSTGAIVANVRYWRVD